MKENEDIDEINTLSSPLTSQSSEDSIDELDDKIQVSLKEFRAEYTNASLILLPLNIILNNAENFDIIKFTIEVKAKYDCKWEVYRNPSEIKNNFSKIFSELNHNNIILPENINNIFTTVAEWAEESIQIHILEIENYYKILFKEPKIYNTLAFKEFFNISSISFSENNGGSKPFEGYCYKKAEPHCCRTVFSYACKCIEYFVFAQFNLRWIVVREDSIFYMDKSNSKIGKKVYFYDKYLKVEKEGRNILRIKNISRNLILKFKTAFEREIWYNEITKRTENVIKLLSRNIYKSYAIEKKGNIAHWFSDGKDYFKDLSEKLMQAKQSIFITDWWMSPEVWLTRPVPFKEYKAIEDQNILEKKDPPYNRLMDILFQCAKRGVQVNILVYAECTLALSLNSKHTENTLERLHPLIKVKRHPLNRPTSLWSHHEKLVIIDQWIGYVGGLDLCWGRWDTHEHPIYEMPNDNQIYFFPGQDYSNARIRDFNNVQKYLKESCDRNFELRMPWHDVHCRLQGPVVPEISKHFIERWNYTISSSDSGITDIKQNVNEDKDKQKNEGFLFGIINNKMKYNSEIIDDSKEELLNPKDENDKENEEIEITEENKSNQKIGKYNEEYEEERKFIEEYMKEIEVIDKDHLYEKKAKTTIKLNKKKQNKIALNTDEELKKAKTNIDTRKKSKVNDVDQTKKVDFYEKYIKGIGKKASNIGWIKKIMKKEDKDKEKELEINIPQLDFFVKGKCTVQVLRSASQWSVGINKKEKSILNAYYTLIDNAKHYIYIENQFFVSRSYNNEEKLNNEKIIVENLIAYHIRKRIERAYMSKEKFRVFIFIPLLPGFDGNPEKNSVIQIILKHTYAGICRNYGRSIIESLKEIMGDKWKEYIGFYSLRGHAMVNNVPATEIIYIHSKLMIIDDTTVILGSANINDRSMLGERDSEFAVLINESKKLNSKMDGKPYKASNFAHSFRVNLLAEHLGIDPKDPILVDPLTDDFLHLVQNTANTNTMIYRKLWGCYPDDKYLSFNDLKEYKEKRTKEEIDQLREDYLKEKDKIKGHVVEFPLHFLEKAKLYIKFFSKENLVPEYNYT